MSIMSWNCQGAGSIETVHRLREIRKEHFPDLLFLMETKQQFEYVLGLKNSLGYDELVTVDPIGLSGGLAVFWKKSLKVNVLYADKRVIDLKISMGTLNFYLSCVYGDPMVDRRNQVWQHLSSIGILRDEAWALIGDFNELMNNGEKKGGVIRPERSFWDFRNMVTNCKIKNVKHSGNMYSWAGWRDKVWVQCRLDRAFSNDEWLNLFPRTQAEYMDMIGSDHRPVLLHFALDTAQRGRGRFSMDKRLFTKPGFDDVIRKGWGEPHVTPNLSVMDRIGRCRTEIAQWKRRENHNSMTTLRKLKESLEKEISKLNPDQRRMFNLKKEIAKAYKEEEIFWKQRSREQWLREGDHNTKYFHNVVKGRKAQNRVLMLMDEENREQFAEGSKGSIAAAYFTELFKSSNPGSMEELFSDFSCRVTPEMNRTLVTPITTDEVRNAAFSVKGESTPGADGFSGAFYRRCWDTVGSAITREIQQCFSEAIMPAGWNHTQIILLPKVTSPTRMTEMRPISLCSVHYKIVSKILCNRLKSVIEELISPTQGAFVSDRLITDNILIAHELVHSLCTDDDISQDYMALKTDMSKAYDRVEWSFLKEVMSRLGFDQKWISWIMMCVSTVSYTVLLNGCTHGYVKPERGIRQGDPLSPFLFIICAEALVHTLNKAERDGLLTGIRLSPTGPQVHHLLFADDSLLLCKATSNESEEIKRRLQLYGNAYGQIINAQKSSIIFGKRVPTTTKTHVKAILEIDKEGGEGTYLGLPECFNGSKSNLLNFIQEKLQARLQGWYAKSLSQGGKEFLLKSVALALPVYTMSVFKLPKNICKKLRSAMTTYWWSSGNNKKKIPWVAWDKMCQRKDKGGLGFHDIELFNQALLAKQAWRVYYQPYSLVAQVLKSKYFTNDSFLECAMGRRPSFAWRSILHGRDLLQKGLIKSIGNGRSTKVLSDKWVMDGCPRAPNPSQAVTNPSMMVVDLMDTEARQWDVTKVRNLFTGRDAEFILKQRVSQGLADVFIWSLTRDGNYSSQSGYRLLESLPEHQLNEGNILSPLERNLWRKIWLISTTPKIKHFFWRALSGALGVATRLHTRGMQVDPLCRVCKCENETICHVLFNCPFAQQVWTSSGIPLPPMGLSRNSVFLNIHYLVLCLKKADIPILTRQAIPWILWLIWKARNNLTFERIQVSAAGLLLQAKEDAEIWVQVGNTIQSNEGSNTISPQLRTPWKKPSPNTLKCNIGSSWVNRNRNCGVAWITRNDSGQALHHGRRSFSMVNTRIEAELQSILWAMESVSISHHPFIAFEASDYIAIQAILHPLKYPMFRHLQEAIYKLCASNTSWTIGYTSDVSNSVAKQMALSVTRDHRYQSYVSTGGPSWLSHTITAEALSSSNQ